MTTHRHNWGLPSCFPFKTERECINCGVVKVSVREPAGPFDKHRTEFWRGLDLVGAATPVCERVEVAA